MCACSKRRFFLLHFFICFILVGTAWRLPSSRPATLRGRGEFSYVHENLIVSGVRAERACVSRDSRFFARFFARFICEILCEILCEREFGPFALGSFARSVSCAPPHAKRNGLCRKYRPCVFCRPVSGALNAERCVSPFLAPSVGRKRDQTHSSVAHTTDCSTSARVSRERAFSRARRRTPRRGRSIARALPKCLARLSTERGSKEFRSQSWTPRAFEARFPKRQSLPQVAELDEECIKESFAPYDLAGDGHVKAPSVGIESRLVLGDRLVSEV